MSFKIIEKDGNKYIESTFKRMDAHAAVWNEYKILTPIDTFINLYEKQTCDGVNGVSNMTTKAMDRDSLKVYRAILSDLYGLAGLAYNAFGTKEYRELKERAQSTFKAVGVLFGAPCVPDIEKLFAFVGSFRKDRETGEYAFQSSASVASFEKSLFRALKAGFTVDTIAHKKERADKRKLAQKARKLAAKQAKEQKNIA